MNASLVITLIGADRPGLVNALAECAADCGANWLESSMAQLAGKFAGIVRLEIAEADAGKLEAALGELEVEGLRLTIERGVAASAPALRVTKLTVVGHDRPGIVREISAALARHGASISKLETACENASFSGEPLFRASIEVQVPASVEPASLKSELEALANELMVDLNLEGES
ncbi:glycine cleavage system protein R [Aromatoleum petrolei]|uniref:ACT domain-containing protein n=1 Tax=Aromatoleum petrolei TaxID=76116 RepID=A0ABX1MM74_9RHOO|nr:ACT domain-containing protein [Aromatoleum petrolei]NMF89060.1 ACT domain-containing protein [Aromatoleum petrolei]QTQ38349.1 Glycine cleavage system transcriptional repressor [Aromatoleum petrolei]